MRYELADHEWTAIKPMPPNKPRGVPRVNDRRVLNGIIQRQAADHSAGRISYVSACALRASPDKLLTHPANCATAP